MSRVKNFIIIFIFFAAMSVFFIFAFILNGNVHAYNFSAKNSDSPPLARGGAKIWDQLEELKTLSFFYLAQAGIGENVLPANEDRPSVKEKVFPKIEYELSAVSGVVMDAESGDILFSKDPDKPLPIASLTKLITALVFIDYNPGWDNVYRIKLEDRREGGKIYLFTGEEVKVKDLFYLSLVGSANTATAALVDSTEMGEGEFIELMNKKADTLGLKNTHFSDPIGLNGGNVSTAKEVAEFIQTALANEEIRSAVLVKKYEFNTIGGRKKTVYNTNMLLDSLPQNGIEIVGGKTGYTEAAGYCFAGRFSKNKREIISVILGAENHQLRFDQTLDLVKLVYDKL